MKINLVYEVNNREFLNNMLLCEELKRRGHNAKIYNKTESVVLGRRNAVTVIPNSYRKEDVAFYEYAFNTSRNRMAIYSCEQVVNYQMPAFFDYTDENPVKKMHNFCWGEDYKGFLTELGFSKDKLSIVGAIHLDYCRKEFKPFYNDKESLSKKYNIPLSRRWILFISDFVFASRLKADQLIKNGDLEKDEVEGKYELENLVSEKILEWYDQYLSTHDDAVVIYRKHPVEMIVDRVIELNKKYPDKFLLISDLNIKEWISNCDVIATWNTTAIIECFFAEKKVALLRPVEFSEKSRYVEYDFYESYPKIKDYKSFEKSMGGDIEDYPKSFLDCVSPKYYVSNSFAFLAIADEIEKMGSLKASKHSGFFIKRWCYLFKRLIPIKVCLKKLFQLFYRITNFQKKNSQAENKYSVDEWIQTAKYRRLYKVKKPIIQKIIGNITNK